MVPRPITAADYATMALNFAPAAGTDMTQYLSDLTSNTGNWLTPYSWVQGFLYFTSSDDSYGITNSSNSGMTALGSPFQRPAFTAMQNFIAAHPTLVD
jgi:hypothetical protein